MNSRATYLLVPVILLAGAYRAMAHGPCGGCESACQPCQPACQNVWKTVQKTIMVPVMSTEMRTITARECRPEQRQCSYTVMRHVPETRQVSHEVCEMVPQTRVRTVNYTVCKPVMSTREQQYTVLVPYTERRQATRTVCRMVPTVMTRTVCEDRGRWEQRAPACATSGCGDCGCATPCQPCRVWVPRVVHRQVQVTCMRPQVQQIPCEYNVTRCRPEVRTRTVSVCHMVNERASRQVQCTVLVPQRRTVTRQVTVMRCVPERKTSSYTVQVAYPVQRQVPVQVCRMVARTVDCRVCVRQCAAPQCPTSRGCCN